MRIPNGIPASNPPKQGEEKKKDDKVEKGRRRRPMRWPTEKETIRQVPRRMGPQREL